MEYSEEMGTEEAFTQWCSENKYKGDHYIQEARKLYPLVKDVINHHELYWNWKDYTDPTTTTAYNVIQREEQFAYEEEHYTYTGKFDGLITLNNGDLYLLEYKFVSNPPKYKQSIPSALQPYAYLNYMRKYYPDVKGVLYDLIGKKPIKYPQPYKSTKRKSQYKLKLSPEFTATYPLLTRWAVETGQELDSRIIAHCKSREFEEAKFIRYLFVPNSNRMKEMMDIINREAMRFVEAKKANHYEKRPTYWSCGTCHYKMPCQNERGRYIN